MREVGRKDILKALLVGTELREGCWVEWRVSRNAKSGVEVADADARGVPGD